MGSPFENNNDKGNIYDFKRWNGNYEPLQKYISDATEVLANEVEEAQLDFFRDLGDWRERYHVLQDTVAFLVATSDAAVGQVCTWDGF